MLALTLAVPAFALEESDVEAAVSSSSREAVTGNVLVWFLCAVGFLKVSQKIDSFMASIGVNVGHTVHDVTLEYPGQIIKLSAYDKPASLGVTITKRGNAQVMAGQSMRYDLTVANTSNVPLESFFWHDKIPYDYFVQFADCKPIENLLFYKHRKKGESDVPVTLKSVEIGGNQ